MHGEGTLGATADRVLSKSFFSFHSTKAFEMDSKALYCRVHNNINKMSVVWSVHSPVLVKSGDVWRKRNQSLKKRK
jgi:hypothetical protein